MSLLFHGWVYGETMIQCCWHDNVGGKINSLVSWYNNFVLGCILWVVDLVVQEFVMVW